jgi:hypothetical protein
LLLLDWRSAAGGFGASVFFSSGFFGSSSAFQPLLWLHPLVSQRRCYLLASVLLQLIRVAALLFGFLSWLLFSFSAGRSWRLLRSSAGFGGSFLRGFRGGYFRVPLWVSQLGFASAGFCRAGSAAFFASSAGFGGTFSVAFGPATLGSSLGFSAGFAALFFRFFQPLVSAAAAAASLLLVL